MWDEAYHNNMSGIQFFSRYILNLVAETYVYIFQQRSHSGSLILTRKCLVKSKLLITWVFHWYKTFIEDCEINKSFSLLSRQSMKKRRAQIISQWDTSKSYSSVNLLAKFGNLKLNLFKCNAPWVDWGYENKFDQRTKGHLSWAW